MIIIHHNDADGVCSAAVAAEFYGKDPSIFNRLLTISMDYKDPFPFNKVGRAEPVLILDFSISAEQMRDLMRLTQDIIWIDHHKSAQKLEEEYREKCHKTVMGYRDFKDKGPAGCELAWKYFFGDKNPPLAVRLVGDFDTWKHTTPDSELFVLGLQASSGGMNPLSPLWGNLIEEKPQEADLLINRGYAVKGFRENFSEEYRKAFGFETTFEGHSAYALNLYKMGSLVLGDMTKNHDLGITFAYDGKVFTVGVYSQKPEVDCAEICTKHGGGGHKGAAGFTCRELPFKREEK